MIHSTYLFICTFVSEVLQFLPKIPLNPVIQDYIFEAIAFRNLSSHLITDEILKLRIGLEEGTSKYRHTITDMDIQNVRVKVNKAKFGVDIRKSPHVNLDEFLGQHNHQRSIDLRESCFLYCPKTSFNDDTKNRLKIGLCSFDQVKLAWKLVHQRYFIMDGTFGISKNKLLTFIIAGVDPLTNHGIPLAEFLFTPDPNHSRDSSSYNSSILKDFMVEWKSYLEETVANSSDPELQQFKNQEFVPLVCLLI
jgi:hypothetical protein